MTQDEILKGNKLIAEFMGHKMENNVHFLENGKYVKRDAYYIPEHEYLCEDTPFGLSSSHTPQTMKYHNSWDWLMPVIIKIEDTPMNLKSVTEYCKVYISRHNDINEPFYYCNIFVNEDTQFNGESKISKIESVLESVVKFIEWYNTSTK